MPLVLLIVGLFFGGCALKQEPLLKIPQDITPFVSQAKSLPSFSPALQESFNTQYFSPWLNHTLRYTKEEALWAWHTYLPEKHYVGEDQQIRPKAWYDTLYIYSNYDAYGHINQAAITIQNTFLRNFPTHKPLFYDPKKAGEGYPFDYMQNSRITLMQPVRISHYSKDKAWALVQSAFSIGWIPSSHIVPVDTTTQQELIRAPKIVITKDNTPVYTFNHRFVSYVKTGTLLPLHVKEQNKIITYRFTANTLGEATKQTLTFNADNCAPWPLQMTSHNLANIGNELLGETYGWGGFLHNRDCSAMTRDFFIPFGFWLPRNSAGQKQFGDYVDLQGLSHQEKEMMIKKLGLPFVSLLYLQGHIMLYAGTYQDKVTVMHNTWGVKTLHEGKEGRLHIGKAILSDLYLGENQPHVDKNALLIAKVEGMTILTKPTPHPLVVAYPESIEAVINNRVIFKDHTQLRYDDGKEKSLQETLKNADIEDHFTHKYPTLAPLSIPPQESDPGRFRNDALLQKLYGTSNL